MKLPNQVIPILEKITGKKGPEIEFWNYLSGDCLDDIDMFIQFSNELMISNINEESLSEIYILVMYIFHWEISCQFSAWYAIPNNEDDMDKIISCYRAIGLESEADALTKTVEAWFSTNENLDKVSEAYKSVQNKYSNENVRFSYLCDYFSKNSRFFYKNSTTMD